MKVIPTRIRRPIVSILKVFPHPPRLKIPRRVSSRSPGDPLTKADLWEGSGAPCCYGCCGIKKKNHSQSQYSSNEEDSRQTSVPVPIAFVDSALLIIVLLFAAPPLGWLGVSIFFEKPFINKWIHLFIDTHFFLLPEIFQNSTMQSTGKSRMETFQPCPFSNEYLFSFFLPWSLKIEVLCWDMR